MAVGSWRLSDISAEGQLRGDPIRRLIWPKNRGKFRCPAYWRLRLRARARLRRGNGRGERFLGIASMPAPEPRSEELLRLVQAGNEDAATAVFDRYVERLLALARARIGPKLKRRLDPEDVVQSAYRSFFVHARDGEFSLGQSGDLWRLLAGITLHKLHGQFEKHTAAKRNPKREVVDSEALEALASRAPTVADVVAVGELLNSVLARLAPDERRTLEATLQGQDAERIAAELGKSERTVRRLLAQARSKIEERLLAPLMELEQRPGVRASEFVPAATTLLTFNDFVLKRLIGAGGMGKVYQAVDKRTGQVVAFKALHKARRTDERSIGSFLEESRILSGLRHPNIVAVHGLGKFPGGGHFIVMDYVDGVDLQSRLDRDPDRQGALALAEAVSIVKQVAGAIGYAHSRGIVHCDVKPANVLLEHGSGRALLTDFGFAFDLAERGSRGVSGIGGSLGYIAPEVLRQGRKPTPAADIFGLGALLMTLVKGKAPSETGGERQKDEGGRMKDEPADEYGHIRL